MSAPLPFALTKLERESPLWLRLKEHLEEKLEKERLQNDVPCPEFETAKRRGAIAMLKTIVALDKERPNFD